MRILVVLAIYLCLLALPAYADQTRTLSPYPITLSYPDGAERVADKVADVSLEWLPELMQQLGVDRMQPIRMILVPHMEDFEKRYSLQLPDWGIGFAFMNNQTLVVDVTRATGNLNGLERVVPHELSHLLVAQRVGGVAMPIWFMEGLGQWQAKEWSLMENWRLMEAVWGNRAPSLAALTNRLPSNEAQVRDAYRVAYTAFLDRFEGRYEELPEFLASVASSGEFSGAFDDFFPEDEFTFYANFDRSLREKYRSRLLLFQAGPLFSMVAVLFVFVYLKIRWRNRKKLQRLERIEQGLSGDDGPDFR